MVRSVLCLFALLALLCCGSAVNADDQVEQAFKQALGDLKGQVASKTDGRTQLMQTPQVASKTDGRTQLMNAPQVASKTNGRTQLMDTPQVASKTNGRTQLMTAPRR